MRRWIPSLALCVLLAGCSLQDVNSVAVIDYERKDNALEVSAKTVGNLFIYAAAAPLLVGYAIVAAAAEDETNRLRARH